MNCRILFVAAILMIQGRAEAEVHLIPAGYTGSVTIAFRAANGRPAAREADARLYEIPASGVLVTQEDLNVGSSPAWRFFVVSSTGERTRVTQIWTSTVPDTPENRANTSIEVFYPRRGRLQRGALSCDVEYDQYFVGTRAQALANDQMADLRRLQQNLVKNFVSR